MSKDALPIRISVTRLQDLPLGYDVFKKLPDELKKRIEKADVYYFQSSHMEVNFEGAIGSPYNYEPDDPIHMSLGEDVRLIGFLVEHIDEENTKPQYKVTLNFIIHGFQQVIEARVTLVDYRNKHEFKF